MVILCPSISFLLTSYISIAAAVDVNNTFFPESLAVLESLSHSVSYITIHVALLFLYLENLGRQSLSLLKVSDLYLPLRKFTEYTIINDM